MYQTRCSRACGSYHDFRDKELLLTMKLLRQRFLVVKLKSSLRTFYGYNHDLVNLFRFHNHNSVLSSFITYHLVWNKSHTTGVICGARSAYHSGVIHRFLVWVRVARSLVFWVMFCESLFFHLSFNMDQINCQH